MNECIVSQIHIPPYDKQGGLHIDDKLKILELSISSLRHLNPDAYIILTGHGHIPLGITLDQCDFIYWESKCRPLDNSGNVAGMPAQFKFVSAGIKHALERGYSKVLKTRGDCVIGTPNICQWSDDILEAEKKRMLVTQMTATKAFKLGDCFMYGDTTDLFSIWNADNPVLCFEDGVKNTGENFVAKCIGSDAIIDDRSWTNIVKKYCSFRDVTTIKFMDLRYNINKLSQFDRYQIVHGDFNYNQYYWGKTNGWFNFDEHGNDSIRFDGTTFTEKIFYENN